ncbi:MAG: hypothetical protein HY765_06995, partial [Rhodomicrobium sp.]|nr:hypothetical protein [Rhodomicrobium sp.]
RVVVAEKDGAKALSFEVIESKQPAKTEESDGEGEDGRTPTALIPKVPLNR